MRVLMTGGGTGGHVNPAIAIADKIKEKEPDSDIAFVGTPRGIENKIVPAVGYRLYHVDIRGLKRSLSLENLRTAALMIKSHREARKLLKLFKPDLVFGTGGYVCWPVVKAASEMGIPTALHESNASPGAAVKILEAHVDRIYVNFESTLERLHHPEKAMRVGNPLRSQFSEISREEALRTLGYEGKYRRIILSCGGSLGAEKVNCEVLRFMRDYVSHHPEIKHIHASGSIERDAAKEMFDSYGLGEYPNLELCEYIYDMPLKMAAADLVINRAGAITLSELAFQGKPCVLIPSPNVTDNHQYKNAHELEEAGAALLLQESELEGDVFTEAVSALVESRERLAAMSDAIRRFAVPDSADRIYADIRALLDGKAAAN